MGDILIFNLYIFKIEPFSQYHKREDEFKNPCPDNPTSKIATPKTKKTDDKSLILYSGFLRHPLVVLSHAAELDELNPMLAFVVLQVLPSTRGHTHNDTRGLASYRSETPTTARLSIRALAVVSGSVLLEQRLWLHLHSFEVGALNDSGSET